MTTFDIGDLAVSDDWTLPCNMSDVAVDGTVEDHLGPGSVQTPTVIELVVGLLVVRHVELWLGVHR
jgi:hypothetical protein